MRSHLSWMWRRLQNTQRNSWKAKNRGVPRLWMAQIQSLRRDYENLSMEDKELIFDYFGKLLWVVIDLKSLGEEMFNVDLSIKLLRSVSSKFDSITTSIKQLWNLDTLSVDEIIGTLKIHEDKFWDWSIKREEKVLMAHALGKNKKIDSTKSSQLRGKGRGHSKGRGRGRGWGRSATKNGSYDENERSRNKSSITCYNCQKKGHYSNECYLRKRDRR